MVFACGGDIDYRTAHSFDKGCILSLGVNDDNIRIPRKHKVGNLTFAGKGFT